MHKPHFDAGHGGNDPGAIGVVHEEDITLSIARFCYSAAIRQGWKPGMTRTVDKTIVLASRAAMAKKAGADTFNSIHVDWSGAKGNGFALITPKTHDTKSSWRLADYIMDELDPLTKYKDTGIYADRRGLAVLRGTDMPACLIEVLSVNDKVLKDPSFHKEVAEQIIQGLCRFYKTTYVPEGGTKKPMRLPCSQAIITVPKTKVTAFARDLKAYHQSLMNSTETHVVIRIHYPNSATAEVNVISAKHGAVIEKVLPAMPGDTSVRELNPRTTKSIGADKR